MAILTIGQNKQFSTISSAIGASRDGDVLAVDAGTYTNDFATIDTKITLKGVDGMVKMVATTAPGNGKGILVTNTDVNIDQFEFSGTAVPDGNGAGIRYQGGALTITNSYFHDNENGLLANPSPSGSITIRDSEFSRNGAGDGYTHNLYVGEIGSLAVSDSYFHDAVVGHQIKSRAYSTTITDSRISDGADGTGSYSIDLPNGGAVVIKGNVIEQGANSGNPVIISYGVEGNVHGASALEVSGNTFLNDKASPSTKLLWNATSETAILTGNSVSGLSPSQYGTGPMTIEGMSTLGFDPGVDTSSPWGGTGSPAAVPTPAPVAEPSRAPEPTAAPEPVPAPEPAPPPEASPKAVPLTIQLGADSWLGDPVAIVTLNGEVVFDGEITAPHATGGQLVELGTVDANQPHEVSVRFINDAWGGTASTDRNLYVEGIQVGGVDTGQSQVLLTEGTASFTVEAAQPASAATAAPTDGMMFLATSQDDAPFGAAEWDAVRNANAGPDGNEGTDFARMWFGGEADGVPGMEDLSPGGAADGVMIGTDQPVLTDVFRTDLTAGDFLFA